MTKSEAIQRLEQAGHVLDAPKAGWFERWKGRNRETVPLAPFDENAACPSCGCIKTNSKKAEKTGAIRRRLYQCRDGHMFIYHATKEGKQALRAGYPEQVMIRTCLSCYRQWVEAMPPKETHEQS